MGHATGWSAFRISKNRIKLICLNDKEKHNNILITFKVIYETF